MNIPEILKARRIKLNISQAALAKYLGFRHRSSINRFETGEREWYLKDVIKACELLKLTLTIE